eukprot:gene11622-24336_t
MAAFEETYINDAVWNYLSRRNEWKPLHITASNDIENALEEGEKNVDIEKRGKSYSVDICDSTMSLAGSSNSPTVKLQRQSNKSTPPDPVWVWDDGGIWVEYSFDECELFNAAKTAGLPCVTIFVGQGPPFFSFLIDFGTNTQVSLHNGFQRQIQEQCNNIPTSGGANPVIQPPTVLSGSIRETAISTAIQRASKATASSDEECLICMEVFNTNKISLRLANCGEHFYCESCVTRQLRTNGKCALCGIHYVVLEGNQPHNATMHHQIYPSNQMTLDGFAGTNTGTIMITYNVPGGVQGPEHPRPGSTYSGTTRHAFLPDNIAGREVLSLLQRAFDQRLVFTIGRSLTTDIDNCIIWNGIHHKTSPTGGAARYGWPDDTYFERVKEELRAKGITP